MGGGAAPAFPPPCPVPVSCPRRHEPNEWLYDRFSKLDFPSVLAQRRGIPFSLAALATCVAARVSVPAMPLCAPLVARCAPEVLGAATPQEAHGTLQRGSLAAESGVEGRPARYAQRASRYDTSLSDKWVVRWVPGAAQSGGTRAPLRVFRSVARTVDTSRDWPSQVRACALLQGGHRRGHHVRGREQAQCHPCLRGRGRRRALRQGPRPGEEGTAMRPLCTAPGHW